MAFRFDMQSKTPQQQAIVAKRDAEDKRRREEIAKKEVISRIPDNVNTNTQLLTVDMDTCPNQDNIIMKQQCTDCQYCLSFKMYNGQPCVECLYISSAPQKD